MKKVVCFLIVLLVLSCKSEKKEDNVTKNTNNVEKEVVAQKLDEDIKAIQEGLDNFWEVEVDNGFKLIVSMDKIYYVKENPTDTDFNTRYFLHVTLKDGEKINLDFYYKDFELKSKNDSQFKDFAIAVRELPKEPIFAILTGQFDENGRLWQQVIHEQNFY